MCAKNDWVIHSIPILVSSFSISLSWVFPSKNIWRRFRCRCLRTQMMLLLLCVVRMRVPFMPHHPSHVQQLFKVLLWPCEFTYIPSSANLLLNFSRHIWEDAKKIAGFTNHLIYNNNNAHIIHDARPSNILNLLSVCMCVCLLSGFVKKKSFDDH